MIITTGQSIRENKDGSNQCGLICYDIWEILIYLLRILHMSLMAMSLLDVSWRWSTLLRNDIDRLLQYEIMPWWWWFEPLFDWLIMMCCLLADVVISFKEWGVVHQNRLTELFQWLGKNLKCRLLNVPRKM